MKKYLVRKNCEYSIEVEADSPENAIDQADEIPLLEWGSAWAADEAEEVG